LDGFAGRPAQALQENFRLYFKRSRNFDQRVGARNSLASLELADGRAVQRSPDTKLFLRKAGSLASTRDIAPEPNREGTLHPLFRSTLPSRV
jgi:hypothetical protein